MAYLDVGYGSDQCDQSKASGEHRFIFVGIDYFTEWVKAAMYANLKKVQVTRFINNNIFFGYGLPQSIITDNGKRHIMI